MPEDHKSKPASLRANLGTKKRTDNSSRSLRQRLRAFGYLCAHAPVLRTAFSHAGCNGVPKDLDAHDAMEIVQAHVRCKMLQMNGQVSLVALALLSPFLLMKRVRPVRALFCSATMITFPLLGTWVSLSHARDAKLRTFNEQALMQRCCAILQNTRQSDTDREYIGLLSIGGLLGTAWTAVRYVRVLRVTALLSLCLFNSAAVGLTTGALYNTYRDMESYTRTGHLLYHQHWLKALSLEEDTIVGDFTSSRNINEDSLERFEKRPETPSSVEEFSRFLAEVSQHEEDNELDEDMAMVE